MAKFLCALSGIQCEVSYLPISLHSREYAHPIFFLPQPKLLGLFSKYESGDLGDIESYLLYLAAFNSTDLVDFRVPASYTPKTQSIVACNLESLMEVVYKLNAIKTPAFQVPRFAVTPETKTLENSHFWIAAWEAAIQSFLDGNRRQLKQAEIQDIEERIYRHILDPNTKPTKYATALSIWAARAASFPDFNIQTQYGTMTLSSYWQLIIRKCVNDKAMFEFPEKDIEELIQHCEDNLEMGTVYAHSLLTLLREGAARHSQYLGLGDLDLVNLDTTYTILEDSSVQAANLVTLVNCAPAVKPKRSEYPNEFEYQRARIRYLAASRTNKGGE